MSIQKELESIRTHFSYGISRFEESLHPDWIEQALQATGSASIRHRKMPADQAIWLVLGMGLLEDRSIVDIVDHLDLVLPGVESLSGSAVTQARYRLGPHPLAWLFEKVANTWGDESTADERWHDLSVYAVDGTCLCVPDTEQNRQAFGKPRNQMEASESGYAQVRLTWMINAGTRLMRAANFGPYATSERVLAAPLWSKLPENSLVIIDRGLHEYRLFAQAVADDSNRHVLSRARLELRYETLEFLSDGSQRARLDSNWRVRQQHPEVADCCEIRVIEYQHPGGDLVRLFTTLLDHEKYPADEIVALYHQRWEAELGYDELKTHMLERKEALRSIKHEGIEQELWGLLLAYNLVRREMLLAARVHDVSPRRISFRSALLWIQTFLLVAGQTCSPGTIPRHLGELRSTLNVLILPERRSERRYPRALKTIYSRYPPKRAAKKSPLS